MTNLLVSDRWLSKVLTETRTYRIHSDSCSHGSNAYRSAMATMNASASAALSANEGTPLILANSGSVVCYLKDDRVEFDHLTVPCMSRVAIQDRYLPLKLRYWG